MNIDRVVVEVLARPVNKEFAFVFYWYEKDITLRMSKINLFHLRQKPVLALIKKWFQLSVGQVEDFIHSEGEANLLVFDDYKGITGSYEIGRDYARDLWEMLEDLELKPVEGKCANILNDYICNKYCERLKSGNCPSVQKVIYDRISEQTTMDELMKIFKQYNPNTLEGIGTWYKKEKSK